MAGGQHGERGRRDGRGQAVHPLVGPCTAAQLEDESEQHPDPERAEDGRRGVAPARRQEHGVGHDAAGEREHDALSGRPHAVEPEPSRGRHGLQQYQGHEQGVRTDRGTEREEQAETRGDRGGLHPRRDDRRTPLGAGPLGIGDPAVAQGGGRAVVGPGGGGPLTVRACRCYGGLRRQRVGARRALRGRRDGSGRRDRRGQVLRLDRRLVLGVPGLALPRLGHTLVRGSPGGTLLRMHGGLLLVLLLPVHGLSGLLLPVRRVIGLLPLLRGALPVLPVHGLSSLLLPVRRVIRLLPVVLLRVARVVRILLIVVAHGLRFTLLRTAGAPRPCRPRQAVRSHDCGSPQDSRRSGTSI